MPFDPDQHRAKAQNQAKENKAFLARIKKKTPKDLDDKTGDFHDEAFALFDCLECANCCKSISPIVIDRDIDRMARHLKMRPSELIEKHLRLDSDGDYVFQSSPCPFLMADNYCMIYEVRPAPAANIRTPTANASIRLPTSPIKTLLCVPSY